MKTVQKTFRFIPKLSEVKFIDPNPSIFFRRVKDSQCGKPVRKEKTQSRDGGSAEMRSQLGLNVFTQPGVRPYVFSGAGMTIFDTVMVSPFSSPVSLTV